MLPLVHELTVVGLTPQSPAQLPAATISGHVIDGVSGRPIEGATVVLTMPRAPAPNSAAGGGSGRSGRAGGGTPVAMVPGARSDLQMTTGSSGQFTLAQPGGFSSASVSATKPGYREAYLGQLGPRDYYAALQRVDLAGGGRLSALVIRLWPDGVITGRVTDERGNAVGGAQIEALERVYTGAGPRWERPSPALAHKTDDQGLYTIDRFLPGDYLIAVRPPAPKGADARSVLPTYYPGVLAAANAGVVTIAPGDTRSADIVVDFSRRYGPLSGRLIGADRSLEGATVRLAPLDRAGSTTEFDEITTIATPDGRFRFTSIPEGDYGLSVCDYPHADPPTFTMGGDTKRTVTAYPGGILPDGLIRLAPLPDSPTWVADVPVAIQASGTPDLTIALRSGARISGRVVFAGTSPQPAPEDLETIPVVIRRADGGSWGSGTLPASPPQPRIETDSRFRSIGLPPGEYVLNVYPASRSSGAERLRAWRASSITVGGRETIGGSIALGTSDITDVVVTMTDKVTELAGTVGSDAGTPAMNARVIVFPRDPAGRNQYLASPAPQRVLLAVPDRLGNFRTAVLPGEYLVAAVTTLPTLWMAPEYLQSLVGQATAVRVELGESRTVSVRAR